jgi:hypothetical protein
MQRQRWNKSSFTVPRMQEARPQLLFRSELWIALLGPSMEEGIVGIGPTVAAALRAFDAQYLTGLRPPRKLSGQRGTHPKADPNSGAEVSSCMTLVAHCSSRLSYPTVQSG